MQEARFNYAKAEIVVQLKILKALRIGCEEGKLGTCSNYLNIGEGIFEGMKEG